MAVDLPEVHARSLDATRVFVAGVGDGEWPDASVCDGWTVRELVNHVVTGNWWAEALAGGKTIAEVGDVFDGDVLGDDPARAYDDSAVVAAAAFRAPGAMDAPCAVSYGPVPGSIYCGHRFMDVLVHGWDIAKSTGQDATLPPDLVDACREVLEPQLDMLVTSGLFGEAMPVADDADAQTRLLAVLGRRA